MKARNLRLSYPLIAGSSLLASTAVQAVDGTWNANSAGNWSDTTKWSGGTVADGTDGIATFANVINGDRIITLDSVRTIGSLSALDTTNNFTISGANALTLDVGTGVSLLNNATSGRTLFVNTPVIVNDGLEKTGPGAVNFGGPITLAAAQTWTNNSAAALTTGNGTNLLDNAGFSITVDGSGVTNFGSVGLAPVAITGSGALVKSGTGRLNIGGVNSGFTGTVTVNGGILHVYNDANALNNGNVTLNGGVLSFYWGLTYSRTLGTGTSQVQILGGESGFAGSGTTGPTINLGTTVIWGAAGEGAATGFFNPGKFVLGDAGTANAAATTFSSGINFNGATRTIVVPAGSNAGLNRTTISGAISNSEITAAGFIKEGGGLLTLSNNSSAWNGDTTVSGGILDLAGVNLANIGGGTGRNITVAAGAGVRFNALNNAALNRIVETSGEITVMSGTTANNLDFSSSTGANLPNAFLGNWAGNGAKMEYSGTLTPASDNYRLGGRGSAGLLGIRSVLSGTQGVIVGGTGGSGIRVNLVAANTHTGDTVISTGARLTLGNNLALQNSPLNVGAAGGNFSLAAGTNAGRITGETATASPTFGGLKGSRNLLSVFSNAAGNNETNLAATAVTGFTLNPGPSVTCTYSGVIANFAAGTTIIKTGDGTQILSGINTYTGATTVSGGTLGLGATGSIAASASVSIGAAGTLDTSGQATHVIPAAQPLAFGIDATGSGSSGKIAAAGLDIEDAVVTFNVSGTPDDPVYVLATYTTLTGTAFAAPLPVVPSGYTLDYAYQGNKIALVATGGTPYGNWSGGASSEVDTNGDGVSNGVAWVLGAADPNANAIGLLPTLDNTSDPTYVRFVFNRSDAAAADPNTAISVEYGTTLAGWTTAVDDNDNVEIEVTNGSPNDTVVVKLKRSTLAPTGRIFARLKSIVTP